MSIIYLHLCVITMPLLLVTKTSGSLQAAHNELCCCTKIRLYRIKKITRYMNLYLGLLPPSCFKAQSHKVKSEN